MHTGDDNHVASFKERVADIPEAVDLLVNDGFLLDINIRGRNVSFRLVVVVIKGNTRRV